MTSPRYLAEVLRPAVERAAKSAGRDPTDVTVSTGLILAISDDELANIKANYSIITPENCMKPQSVHPTEDNYTWTRPDAMVKWCQDNECFDDVRTQKTSTHRRTSIRRHLGSRRRGQQIRTKCHRDER